MLGCFHHNSRALGFPGCGGTGLLCWVTLDGLLPGISCFFFLRLLNPDAFKMPVFQKLLYGRKGLSYKSDHFLMCKVVFWNRMFPKH